MKGLKYKTFAESTENSIIEFGIEIGGTWMYFNVHSAGYCSSRFIRKPINPIMFDINEEDVENVTEFIKGKRMFQQTLMGLF